MVLSIIVVCPLRKTIRIYLNLRYGRTVLLQRLLLICTKAPTHVYLDPLFDSGKGSSESDAEINVAEKDVEYPLVVQMHRILQNKTAGHFFAWKRGQQLHGHQ